MRKIIKKIIHPIFKLGFDKFYSKSRNYSYKGIHVTVHPEVFPPHFTISTKILLDYLNTIDLKEKSLLELGCGSGIISLFSASKGAIVTATDINMTAINALKKASLKNGILTKVLYSDLFDCIEQIHFDYIIINPPYYPKSPKNTKERAWFCGENFEYFEKLFQQLENHITTNNVLMILSEDCKIKQINNIAIKNGLKLNCIFEQTKIKEKNFLFQVIKNTNFLKL